MESGGLENVLGGADIAEREASLELPWADRPMEGAGKQAMPGTWVPAHGLLQRGGGGGPCFLDTRQVSSPSSHLHCPLAGHGRIAWGKILRRGNLEKEGREQMVIFIANINTVSWAFPGPSWRFHRGRCFKTFLSRCLEVF